MTVEVRPFDSEDDWRAATRLGRLAFGGDLSAPFEPRPWHGVAATWAAYDKSRLVGTLVVIPFEQWWGGRTLPMGGVASVAVAAEDRGRGIAQRLLGRALEGMHGAGQSISALFPTAVGLYRRMGWELAGAQTWIRVRTDVLARVAPPTADVLIRAATEADVPAIARVYDEIARTTDGLLTRAGPSFPQGAAAVLELDSVPVAEDTAGSVVGFASVTRGRGYDEQSCLTVHDLLATRGDAARALLRQIGSWSAVAPHADLRLLGGDVDALLVDSALPPPRREVPWMSRVVDLPQAVSARGWPAGLRVAADLELTDPAAPWQEGRWRLVVEDGKGTAERGGSGSVRLGAPGLACLFSGSRSATVLRRAGLLAGAPDAVAALDLLAHGRPPQLLDYF